MARCRQLPHAADCQGVSRGHVKRLAPLRLPNLPVEVLTLIAEQVENVEDLRNLRVASKALSWGAAKSLFKRIVKQATPIGICDLHELANSNYTLLVHSLILKAPERDSDMFPDDVVSPAFKNDLDSSIQRFTRLRGFGVSLDHRFGAMQTFQSDTKEVMETVIRAAAPPGTSKKRQFTLTGSGHFDIEEFNLWGSLEKHQSYIARFSEVKLDFHLCACYREGVLLSEHINLCDQMEELEITESGNSWITFESTFTTNPPRYKLPALKVLRLCNVLCTTASLIAFLESSKESLTSITLSNIKLTTVHPDDALGTQYPNNTLIESSWVDVFAFFQGLPNLVHYDYRMLQSYTRHSHDMWHYHWHDTAGGCREGWPIHAKKIMNAAQFDHAALGNLLSTVQTNAQKARVPIKLDTQDKKHMKNAKLADAPRRQTRSRTAATKAMEYVDTT